MDPKNTYSTPIMPVINTSMNGLNNNTISPINTSMNSMPNMSSRDSTESLNHSLLVSQRISNLFMNDRYCDGVLIAEQQRIPIIKSIVSQHSKYLDDMFFGNEAKVHEVLLPNDIKVDPLKSVIKYCHSGEILFNEISNESVYELFGVAFQLEFNDLLTGITENLLESKLNKNSVLEMYSNIHKFKASQLAVHCVNYINIHANSLLNHKSFLSLSAEVLSDILSSDEFSAPEIDIFKCVVKWIEQNPGEDVRNVISKLRLYLISFKDLLNIVRKSALITEGIVMEAMKTKANKDYDLKYRAFMSYDKNVLQPKFKPKLISGESRDGNLFSMDHSFGGERGFVFHTIGVENKQILVKLGMPSKVNHIKLLLLDINQNAFSYTVEISLDQNEWYRIADYSMYWCRLWQNISFHPLVIQYIRIVGIRTNYNYPLFGLINLQCYLSSNRINFKECESIPMIIPGNNVATYANGAVLLRYHQNGIIFDRSSELLSGSDKLTTNNNILQLDQNKYNSPATHEITNSPEDNITIHLSQPYLIDRLKFMIYSPDPEWMYSFTVHVSPDGQNYTMVLDKRGERCTDWQECRFQRRPISFIRITGTEAYNTSDRTFRLIHFECSGSPNK